MHKDISPVQFPLDEVIELHEIFVNIFGFHI